MRYSFLLCASLFCGLAVLLGCASPQALLPSPQKRVWVDLESLLPLHPSYSLLAAPEPWAQLPAGIQPRPLGEPEPASAPRTFSEALPTLAPDDRLAMFRASSIIESLDEDRTATLVALKTLLYSRRRAATDLLDDRFSEQKRLASLPLGSFATQATESQLEEIVSLQARLAAPDLSADSRKRSQDELAALRSQRQAALQALQRQAALVSEHFWAGQRLAIERQLAEDYSRVRSEAETTFTSRSEDAATGLEWFKESLASMSGPRPQSTALQETLLTMQTRPGRSFPALEWERREEFLSHIREEVANAVEHIAARNSWDVSFSPRPDAQNVTDSVRRQLSRDFYPSW